MLFLGILAFIVIGPKQLPEVARNIGRFINEMKRASEGLRRDMGISDLQNPVTTLKQEILKTAEVAIKPPEIVKSTTEETPAPKIGSDHV